MRIASAISVIQKRIELVHHLKKMSDLAGKFDRKETPASKENLALFYSDAEGSRQWCVEALKQFDAQLFQSAELVKGGINLDELWLIAIDARDHRYGRNSYDEGTNTWKCAEPGYIDAMENAILFMLLTKEEPLTPEYLAVLHGFCTYGVRMTGASREGDHEVGQASQILSSGRCPLVQPTIAGLMELAGYDFIQVFRTKDKGSSDILYLTKDNVSEFYNHGEMERGECARDGQIKLIEQFFSDYYSSCNKAKNKEDRLLAIAILCSKLEYFHPFRDGNTRVIKLIMTRALLENGLPISTLYDPNIMDGHASKELLVKMKEGFTLYENQVKEMQKNPVSYSAQDFLVVDNKMFMDLYKCISTVLINNKQFHLNREEDILHLVKERSVHDGFKMVVTCLQKGYEVCDEYDELCGLGKALNMAGFCYKNGKIEKKIKIGSKNFFTEQSASKAGTTTSSSESCSSSVCSRI